MECWEEEGLTDCPDFSIMPALNELDDTLIEAFSQKNRRDNSGFGSHEYFLNKQVCENRTVGPIMVVYPDGIG